MNSSGVHPRTLRPAGTPGGKQTLRVLPEEGAARPATPSVAMPRANTELSDVLVCDNLLRVGRRTSAAAVRTGIDAGSSACGVEATPPADLPATLVGQRSQESSSQARTGDEDLNQVTDAWPRLPRNVRAGILAMVRATTTGDA